MGEFTLINYVSTYSNEYTSRMNNPTLTDHLELVRSIFPVKRC